MIRPYPNSSFFPKPRKKNTSGSTPATPATKKQINSFEAEYQKFIADLKAKKAADEAKKEETPVVEEPKAEVIPETVTTVAEDAPILNETTTTKKSKKKKVEPVEETVAEPTIDGLD